MGWVCSVFVTSGLEVHRVYEKLLFSCPGFSLAYRAKWSAQARTRRVCAGGEQKRYRHRIENGDKCQSEQPDRSLKVGGRRADQLGEVSHRADVRLGSPALGVNLGLFDLETGERLARRSCWSKMTSFPKNVHKPKQA